MKIFLIILLVLLLIIPFALGGYLVFFNLFYHKYFSRKGEFLKARNKKFLEENKDTDKSKFDGFSEIKCLSRGVELKGKYKNNGLDKLAILLHSFGADHGQMWELSSYFLQQNYDVLAIDLRAHGVSGGQCSYGLEEGEDLIAWIEHICAINQNYKIVLYGIGVGAVASLTVLDKFPKNVKMVVCESAYDSIRRELSFIISKSKIKPPKKAFFKFLKRTKEINFKDNEIIENVKSSSIPILIMHDEKDEIVPIEMAYSLQEGLPSFNSQILILPNCEHGQGMANQPFKVKSLLEKNLKKYGL